jgi:hypothetical protein
MKLGQEIAHGQNPMSGMPDLLIVGATIVVESEDPRAADRLFSILSMLSRQEVS